MSRALALVEEGAKVAGELLEADAAGVQTEGAVIERLFPDADITYGNKPRPNRGGGNNGGKSAGSQPPAHSWRGGGNGKKAGKGR